MTQSQIIPPHDVDLLYLMITYSPLFLLQTHRKCILVNLGLIRFKVTVLLKVFGELRNFFLMHSVFDHKEIQSQSLLFEYLVYYVFLILLTVYADNKNMLPSNIAPSI